VSAKSYFQLEEENTALRLLLEDAHTFGTHSWACSRELNISTDCDCWFGRTEEALTEPIQLTGPLESVACKCGHLPGEHTGRITGQPQAVCVMCGCPCTAFTPRPDPMGKSPTKS
jgi:hypothetical protein